MESTQEWAARIKVDNEARTPEQVAADEAESESWLASLPVFDEGPLKQGETHVVFFRRRPKKE